MTDVALKITALLGAAWMVSLLLRRGRASTRHAAWTGIMAAALALPLFGALTPSIELALLPAPPGMQPSTPASGAALGDLPLTVVERSAPAVMRIEEAAARQDAPATSQRSPVTLAQGLAAAWLAVALLLAGRVAAAHAQARRMLDACVDPPAALVRTLASVAAELRVEVPPLRIAAAGTMPAVIGVLRPSIVLPADAAAWTAERLRLVLLHECAHVRRRDALLQVVASLATAAYWWHPLTWLAARRIVREREMACDDLVIASGASGSDYAAHLLEIARALKPSRQPALAALAMARRSELEGRVIALLEERPRESRQPRALAFGAALALAALAAIAPLKLVARDYSAAIPDDTQSAVASPAPAAADVSRVQSTPRVGDNEPLEPGGAQSARVSTAADQTAAPPPAPQDSSALASALRRALDDEDGDIRVLAMTALARAEGAGAVPMLLRAFDDADEDMRVLALAQLVRMERAEARALLPRALQDASDDVRAMAVMGLRRLDHPDRVALALTATRDTSDDVRAMAALTLADTDGVDVDAALIRLSEDPSVDVRRAALLAIARRSGNDRDGVSAFGADDAIAHGIAEGMAQGVAQGIAQSVVGGLAGALPRIAPAGTGGRQHQ